MTITEEVPVAWEQVADVPRDSYGRPMVRPLNGGGLVAYQRVTTFIGVLEDTYNLRRYDRRLVARGLAKREDLLMRVASMGDLPGDDDGPRDKKWKQELNTLCEQAMEADEMSAKANIGTSLHAFTERHDKGLAVGVIPSAYRGHFDAYVEATKDFEMVHVERFSVYDPLALGGTADRFLKIPGYDKLVCADTKTGNLAWGQAKIAMQLALYVRSQLYDPTTHERTPLGEVDTERGLIVALNARTGKCDLRWVDIGKGWAGIAIAQQVKTWRAKKGWFTPYAAPEESPPTLFSDPVEGAQELLALALGQAETVPSLTALWDEFHDVWLPRHTLLARQRKAELQGGWAP